jgi:hypothetical protein
MLATTRVMILERFIVAVLKQMHFGVELELGSDHFNDGDLASGRHRERLDALLDLDLDMEHFFQDLPLLGGGVRIHTILQFFNFISGLGVSSEAVPIGY